MPKTKRLDYLEFMGRFGWKEYEHETRVMEPPLELSLIPELRVALAAKQHCCPDAYSAFLQQWLKRVGLEPPPTVFRPIRYRRRGRHEDADAPAIHLTWVALGKPSLSSAKLAQAYYGKAFRKCNFDERKLKKDRLRQAVERLEQRMVRRREWNVPLAFRPPRSPGTD